MQGSLNFEGKKYISAKDAAKQFGYTSDYIGQLCRGGKIKSKLVGRVWYVLESEISSYKKVHLALGRPSKKNSSLKNNSSTLSPKKVKSKKVSKEAPLIEDKKEVPSEIEIYKEAPKYNVFPEISRVAEIDSKKVLYIEDNSELFPILKRSVDLEYIKRHAFDNLEKSKSGKYKATKFDKTVVSSLVAVVVLSLSTFGLFEGSNFINRLKTEARGSAFEEVSLLYSPLVRDVNRSVAQISEKTGVSSSQLALSVASDNNTKLVFDFVRNIGEKLFGRFFAKDTVIVDSDVDSNTVKTIVIKETSYPSTGSIAQNTGSAQAKTVFLPSFDKEYINSLIEEKFVALQNNFLTSTIAPNVNRYYISRQNDVLVDRISRSSSVSSNSGSSGATNLSGLSDISFSSPTYGEILMYNGSSWVNTATSSLGIVSGSSASSTLLGDFNTFTNTNVFTGSIGIGTSTPGYKLSVAGGGFFDGGTVTASTFTATSSVIAPYFNATTIGTGYQLNGSTVLNYSGGFLRLNDLGGGISLRTSSSDRLIIDTAGNVGVGTTSPWGKLSVTNTGTGPSFIVEDSTSPDASPFIIDASGNVGVGTVVPEKALDVQVNSSGQTTLLQLKNNLGNTGVTADIDFSITSAANYAMARIGATRTNRGASLDTDITFSTRSNSVLAERMRIQDTGNVGVGTTSPYAKLSIESTAGAAQFVIGSSTATQFIVDKNGNVGIGTTTPPSPLSISSSLLSANPLFLLGTSTLVSGSSNGEYIGVNAPTGFGGNYINLQLVGAPRFSVTSGGTVVAASTIQGGRFIPTLSSVASGSNAMYLPAANTLGFATNGNLNMVVNSTGNVGIGTTTPWAQLSIHRNTSDSSNSPLFAVASSTASGTTTNFIVANNGNVGIGTTSPNASLNVYNGGTADATLRLENSSGGGTYSPKIVFQSYNTSIEPSSISWNYANQGFSFTSGRSDIGYMNFLTTVSGSPVERLRITNGGNIGIGTTTPAQKLTVIGDALLEGATGYNASNEEAVLYLGDAQTPAIKAVFGSGVRLGANSAPNALSIAQTTGNIGIGTTSPFAKLSVESTAGAAQFVIGSSTATQFIVDKNGNVGVGITNPTAKLEIGTGQLFVNGGGSGTAGAPNVAVGDLTTGIFKSTTAGNLAFTKGGTAVAVMSNGTLRLGSTYTLGWASGAAETTGEDTGLSRLSVNKIGVGNGSNGDVSGTLIAGNVGIGTTSPSGRLTVDAASAVVNSVETAGALVLRSTTAYGIDIGPQMRFSGENGGSATPYAFATIAGRKENATINNSAGYLQFNTTDSASTINERMRITSTGNVGIGTTTPQYKLSVSASSDGFIVADTGAGTFGGFRFQEGATDRWTFAKNDTNDDLIFSRFNSAGTFQDNPFIISNSTGRIGAGSSTPWGLLSVNANGLSSGAPQFVVGSSTATNFIVANNGNVGVGTVNPSSALHVVQSAPSNGVLKIQNTSGTGWSSAIMYDNTGTEKASFGYGNTSASVLAGQAFFNLQSDFVIANSGGTPRVFLSNSSGNLGVASTTPWGLLSVNANGLTSGAPQFVVGSSTATNFIVANNGNVGVGTTGPGNKLDVRGTVTSPGAGYKGVASLYSTDALGANVGAGLLLGGVYTGSTVTEFAQVAGVKENATNANYAGALTFHTRTNGLGTMPERMRVDSNGNLGIGTTSPWAQLSVHRNTSDTSYSPLFAVASSTASGTTTNFIVANNGNVGVGTTSPAYKFAVQTGNTSAYFNNVSNYGLFVTETSGSNGSASFLTKYGSVEGGLSTYSDTSALLGVSNRQNWTMLYNDNGNGLALGTVDSAPVIIGTNNLERVRIDSSGNVGIGTTTPYSRLTVWGPTSGNSFEVVSSASTTNLSVSATGFGTTTVSGLNISGSATSTSNVGFNITNGCYAIGGNCLTSGTLGALSSYDAFTHPSAGQSATTSLLQFFGNASTSQFTATSSVYLATLGGNVGIGTTTPTQKLTIVAGGSSSNMLNGAIRMAVVDTTDSRLGTVVNNAGTFMGYSSSGGYGSIYGYDYAGLTAKNLVLAEYGGNVGIGTTTPSSLFTVHGSGLPQVLVNGTAGDSRIQLANLGVASAQIAYDNSSGRGLNISTLSTAGQKNLFFQTSGSDRMMIDSVGNVGIGTTSPQAVLNIYKAGTANLRLDGNDFTQIDSFNNGFNTITRIESQTETNSLSGSLNFYTSLNNSLTEKMRITRAGNVGIGVSAPGDKLEVSGNVFAAAFNSTSTVSRYNPNGGVFMAGNGGSSFAEIRAYSDVAGTGKILSLNSTGGNVGIGTTAAASPLHVQTSTGVGSLISIYQSSVRRWQIGTTGGADAFKLIDIDSGATPFMIEAASPASSLLVKTSGNVGVGTSSPFAKLSVESTAGAVQFVIGSSTATQFIVDRNGNVGVGTVNPGSKFVVEGSSGTLAEFGTTGSVRVSYDRTENRFRFSGTHGQITTPDGNLLLNPTSGSVSIGSTTPWGLLSVNANGLTSGAPQFVVGSSTATNFIVANNGNVGVGLLSPSAKLDVQGVAGATNIFRVASSTGSDLLTVDKAGNVWIGTTVVEQRTLTLQATDPIFYLKSYGGSSAQIKYDGGSTFTLTDGTTNILQFNNAGSGNDIDIVARNSSDSDIGLNTGNGQRRMTVKYDGNVGIGTTSPFAKLSVESTAGTAQFVVGSSTATQFIVDRNGNVGVGTVAPTVGYKLDVAGSVNISNNLAVGSVISSAGFSASGSGYYEWSGRSMLKSPSDGVISLLNQAQTGFTRLNLGGTSSSFPALAVNGSDLQVIRADGSTNANLLITGNVGIGTTSPQNKLQVQGEASDDSAIVVARFAAGTSDAVHGYLGFSIGINSSATGSNRFTYIGGGDNSAMRNLALNTNGVGSFGNVGIGTTTPGHLLSVGTGAPVNSVTSAFKILANNATDARIGAVVGTGQAVGLRAQTNYGSLFAYDYNATNNLPLVLQEFGNNVGVGSTTPWGLLSVNASGLASGAPQFVVGSSTATNFIVANNGNVGVGTAVPTAALDVVGNLRSGTNGATFATNNLTINNSIAGAPNTQLNFNGNVTTLAGNTNLILQSGASSGNQILFKGGSTTWGVINGDTGTMGLGTTSPFAKLSVESTEGNAQFVIGSSTATQFIVDRNGNVGIGTTNPDLKFKVYDTSKTITSGTGNLYVSTSDSAGADLGGSIVLGGSYTGTSDTTFVQVAGRKESAISTETAGYLTLSTRPNGGLMTERLRINSTGNVGIGSTTPWAQLSVHRNTSDTSYSPLFAVASSTASGTSTNFIVANNGNVGVGTASPSSKLNVEGVATTELRLKTLATNVGAYLNITNPTGGDFWIGREGSGGGNILTGATGYAAVIADRNGNPLQFGTSDMVRMTILPTSGNVGIGTTTPAATLTVTKSGATGNIFAIASSSGENYFTVAQHGTYGSTSQVTIKGTVAINNDFDHSANVFLKNNNAGTSVTAGYTVSAGADLTNLGVFAAYSTNYENPPGYERAGRVLMGHSLGAGGLNLIGVSDIRFNVTDTSLANERMRLTATGLGIGTTSPTNLLHIYGTAPTLRIDRSSGTADSQMIFAQSNVVQGIVGVAGNTNGIVTGSVSGDMGIQVLSGKKILLSTDNGGTADLTINSGKVGIATTTPTHKLSVFDSSAPQISLSSGAGIAQWTMRNAGGNLYLATTTVAGTATTTTSALTILGNGNVGVGSTTPGNALSVTGSIDTTSTYKINNTIRMLASTNYTELVDGSGNSRLHLGNATDPTNYYSNTTHIFRNGAATSEYGRFTSSGYLGVGTSTPWAQLSVHRNTSNTSNAPLFVVASSTASATTTNFIVANNGNVGIGTSAPGFPLQVNGNAMIGATVPTYIPSAPLNLVNSAGGVMKTQLSLVNTGGGAGAGSAIDFFTYDLNGGTNPGLRIAAYDNNYSADFAILTKVPGNEGNSLAERFRVTNAGRVGVGTSTPTATFALQGASGLDILSVATSTGARVLTISSWGGFVQNISSSTAINIQNGSGASVFTVDTTGTASNSGIDITAGSGQTGNLVNLYSSGGSYLSGFTASGAMLMNVSSTTAIDIQNGSNVSVFAVDTTNKWLKISTSTSPTFTTDGQFTIGSAGTAASDGRIWIRSGATTFRFQSTNNTADYSEFFYQLEPSEVGDVLSLAQKEYIEENINASTTIPKDTGVVRKSSVGYDERLLGVYTARGTSFNNPDDNRQKDPNFANVGLLGHVATKVTNENGEIFAGDYITSSQKFPGYGMKATKSGQILGVAIEDFGSATTTEVQSEGETYKLSKVMVMVSPRYQVITENVLVDANNGEALSGDEIQNQTPLVLHNQNDSGPIMQLQAAGQTRLLVANNGAVKMFTQEPDSKGVVFEINNNGGSVFSINSAGDVKVAGAIYIESDSFAGSIATNDMGLADINFANNLGTGKPVIQLTPEGDVPTIAQVASWKKDLAGNYIGLVIKTFGTEGQAVTANVHYAVFGKRDGYETTNGIPILTNTTDPDPEEPELVLPEGNNITSNENATSTASTTPQASTTPDSLGEGGGSDSSASSTPISG